MEKITIKSPAKVNLTLDVFSKKEEADFHEIKTIFHKVDFGDVIDISKSDKFKIMGNFNFPEECNLIFKAWKLIEKFIDPRDFHPVRVKVEKNIPEGGGLGGGSSNFANFVKGYFSLFNLGEIPKGLVFASSEYGKDIPFFFFPDACAMGSHFGEVVTKVPFVHDLFLGKKIYLYIPQFQNNTKDMYKTLSTFDTQFTDTFLRSPKLDNCGNSFNEFLSDSKYQNLFPPKFDIQHPKIEISGSGSCFFSFEALGIVGCRAIETFLL